MKSFHCIDAATDLRKVTLRRSFGHFLHMTNTIHTVNREELEIAEFSNSITQSCRKVYAHGSLADIITTRIFRINIFPISPYFSSVFGRTVQGNSFHTGRAEIAS